MLTQIRSIAKTIRRQKSSSGRRHEHGEEIPLVPILRPDSPRFYLTVTAMIKNEAPYLEEWLNFHRLVGVEHFYIYDNESTDATAEILASYERKGLVTVFPWPSFLLGWNGQCAAYAHATAAFRTDCRWMMFIDMDEFVFPSLHGTLPDALKSFEDYSVVHLTWRCFGHSGHKAKPEGLVIENYMHRAVTPSLAAPHLASRLTKAKSIADPCRITNVHIHKPRSDDEKYCDATDAILINHYFTRSEDEFASKLNLERVYRQRPEERAKRSELYRAVRDVIEQASVEDLDIQRFIPELKQRLARNSLGNK